MTKLINADELINSFDNSDFDNTDPADNLMNAVHIVNSMPYVEAYSKDEVIAMLTELQLEIKELWDSRYDVWLDNQYYIGKSDTLGEVDEIIQQKINKLKGEVK